MYEGRSFRPKERQVRSDRRPGTDTCQLPFLVCFEVDSDLGLDFDWIAIEVVRFISPLADSFQRGARENGVSTQHFQIGDVTLFVDGRFDLHCALGTNRKRGWRILWLYPLDQQSLGHTLRNSYGCQRRPGNT